MKEPTAFGAHQLFSLEGKRVLVTGAAHGLGLGIASALDSAGAQLALLDLDATALESTAAALSRRPATYATDVGDEASVAAAVAGADQALGGIDIVFNCAAIYPTGLIAEVSDDEFMSVLNINVAGYRRMIRAALPSLRRSTAAAVVNIASITFYLGFPPGLSSYITSKGAIVALTRALARELGPDGIRVNAIAPGAFPTRAEEIIEDRAAYDVQILESQCIKRRGEVADIACAAMYLASPAAGFITGQMLAVDGGWTFH